jgi:hypothetical protein
VAIPPEELFETELLTWARALVTPMLDPDESLDDVMYATSHLAAKRASLHDRSPTSLDLLAQLLMWKICIVDPHTYETGFVEQLKSIRKELFAGAASGDIEGLEAAVPASTLYVSIERLHDLLALNDIHEFLRLPPDG